METNRRAIAIVFLAVLVIVGMGVPAMALSSSHGSSVPFSSEPPMASQQTTGGSASGVSVMVGQQLSTIIAVSSDEIQTDFENTAFEFAVEAGDDDRRSAAIADRAEELRERAKTIRGDYDEATAAYESGDITQSEYAQRLATLNARATNLIESYEQFQQRASSDVASEREEAEFNQSALNESIENLDTVSGAGTAALLRQFVGDARGEIEIETADGLEIEIESEDGERSREFERPRDDDDSLTVNQSDALESALAVLSTPANGSWEVTESEVEDDDGAYEFEFELRGAAGLTGEAEVDVDGSTGKVFSLEEEIETRDDDDQDDDDDDQDDDDDDQDDDDDDD